MKKKVYGIMLIAAVLAILLLTLQDAAGTVKLSEGLRLWLERFGITMTFHSIRSNAHLVLYFLFGIILCLYGRECGWRWWVILAVGWVPYEEQENHRVLRSVSVVRIHKLP